LRFGALDAAAFNIDEAVLSILASQTARLGRLHALGIRTSFGFYNPPFLIYLVAPFFALASSPLLAMGFFAALGTAAIGLVALSARRLFGARAGAVAAVLIAFSPLAAEHCRRLWGHDTIVLWTALCVYAALRATRVGEERREAPAGPSAGAWLGLSMMAAASAQVCHLSGALLWVHPLGCLAFLVRKESPNSGADGKKSDARPGRSALWLAVGMGGAWLFLLYAPWLWSEATNEPRFEQTRIILGLLAGRSANGVELTPVPAPLCWGAILGDGWLHTQIGFMYPDFLAGRPWLRAAVWAGRALSILATLGGVLALLGAAIKRDGSPGADRAWRAMIAVGLLSPVLLFTALPLTSVPAYQLPALVPAVLAAAFLLRGRRCAGSRVFDWSRLAVPLLAFYILLGGAYTSAARLYLIRATPNETVHATLDQKRRAVEWILEGGKGAEFTLMQEARPASLGIDLWVIYIHYWLTGNHQAPLSPEANVIFLIHDAGIILPDIAEDFLREREAKTFGPMWVYRLEGAAAEEWRSLVTLGPPPNFHK
jgi:hypothetical protein